MPARLDAWSRDAAALTRTQHMGAARAPVAPHVASGDCPQQALASLPAGFYIAIEQNVDVKKIVGIKGGRPRAFQHTCKERPSSVGTQPGPRR